MGVLIRILVRYLAGFLVLKAVVSPETADIFSYDPDISAAIEAGIGLLGAALVEGWYLVAKRLGWQT